MQFRMVDYPRIPDLNGKSDLLSRLPTCKQFMVNTTLAIQQRYNIFSVSGYLATITVVHRLILQSIIIYTGEYTCTNVQALIWFPKMQACSPDSCDALNTLTTEG